MSRPGGPSGPRPGGGSGTSPAPQPTQPKPKVLSDRALIRLFAAIPVVLGVVLILAAAVTGGAS